MGAGHSKRGRGCLLMPTDEAQSGAYEETVPFTLAIAAAGLMAAFAVMMLVFYVLQVTDGPVGSRSAPDWVYLVMFLFLGAVAAFIASLRRLTIRVGAQAITVGFGRIRRTIPWANIEGCFVDDSSLLASAGWGIRLAPVKGQWRLAFNAGGKSAVVLRLKSGRPREFMFSTANAQHLVDIISRNMG